MKWFTFEGRKPQENQRILGLLKDICNLDLVGEVAQECPASSFSARPPSSDEINHFSIRRLQRAYGI
jgi:hypothetical protein